MGWFSRKGRRPELPRSARPVLARDERILAWAATATATEPMVVTSMGLWLPGRPRLGWHEIHKAIWAGASGGGRLTVVPSVQVESVHVNGEELYAIMADGETVEVTLPDPGDVPEQVRTRVTRSVAYTAHHTLSGGGVRVVARRVPGVDGLTWHVRFDASEQARDHAIVAATTELVAATAGPRRPD